MEISTYKYNELIRDQNRYEYLRRLNPREFQKLFNKNLRTCVFFDTLVDQEIEKLNKIQNESR